MTVVVLYSAKEDAVIQCSMNKISNFSIPSFVFGLAALGKGLWNKGLLTIEVEDDMDTKFEILTKIHIWQWVLVQLGTLMLLTFTLMESNFYYFMFALVNIIYFFTLRPKIFSLTGET
tara:strand:+ start:669 stop:1022 length:354 start_codon:yes stop_codon:yes gene_type:complete